MAGRRKEQGKKDSLEKRIKEHLKEVFAEEGSEVGIRLARAKVAEQEGFGNVAACLREIAYDEAKHAALIAELLYQDDIRDTKSNVRATISGDQYAYHRELEFLQIAKKAGEGAVVKLVEQLAADEQAHIQKLEALTQQLGWHK